MFILIACGKVYGKCIRTISPSPHSPKDVGSARRFWTCLPESFVLILSRNTRDASNRELWRWTMRRYRSTIVWNTTIYWPILSTGEEWSQRPLTSTSFSQWIPMNLYQSLWSLLTNEWMNLDESRWISMNSNDSRWISMISANKWINESTNEWMNVSLICLQTRGSRY